MNINNCYCVIMAGGSGTRFWPVSRTSKPKQFLDMAGTGKTFIQQTYERFLRIVPKENILIVTAAKYKDLVLEQIPELDSENLLLEPYSRNTAPCIAYATYKLLQRNPEANIVVTPSDHAIDNDELFAETIRKAFEYVEDNDVLMTLGVLPTRPDTNYGYVQAVGGKKAYENDEPMEVKTFTEKPDKDMANLFISTGEFFWNAGIFVWRGKTIKSEMERHLPEVTGLFIGWEMALGSKIEKDFIAKAYTDCINISIDYGVMEHAKNVCVMPSDFGWSDLGTWGSLYELSDKDEHQNVILHSDAIYYDSHGNIVTLPKGHLAVIQGLEDCIVSESNGVLLICKRADEQQIRQFYMDAELKFEGKFN